MCVCVCVCVLIGCSVVEMEAVVAKWEEAKDTTNKQLYFRYDLVIMFVVRVKGIMNRWTNRVRHHKQMYRHQNGWTTE